MTTIERDILELKIKYSEFRGAPTADQILRVCHWAERELRKDDGRNTNEMQSA